MSSYHDLSVADIVLAPRGESRRLRGAAVAALLAHFVAFAAVLPHSGRTFDVAAREAVVLRRYQPPKPPPKSQPAIRRATRVPIPDATPSEPEPLLELEPIIEPSPVADTEFVITAPTGGPEPVEVANAVDIETDGLQPPHPLRRVQPRYDPERARRGIQGRVDIQIVIDEAGMVRFARVLNGTEDEELDRLAMEAVRQWEFTPATLSGTVVPVRAVVTINYRIY